MFHGCISPLEVKLPPEFNPANINEVKTTTDQHQNRLKELGNWIIFPKTLEYIANGKYSQDEKGRFYFNGKGILDEISLEGVRF